MKQRKRTQLVTLSLEEVFPFIGIPPPPAAPNPSFMGSNGEKYTPKVRSLRLIVLKNNPKCVSCGIEGTHFVIEKDRGKFSETHLNMYSADGVLMTQDHIKPRSKGGLTELSNLQTMCEKCNALKGDQYISEKEEGFHL